MNVVDSSGWVEFFTDAEMASVFAPVVEATDELIVPTITLYEVFKWILVNHSEDAAIHAVAHMRQGRVADLDSDIAVSAAHISVTLKIPMADSVILGTARRHGAVVWTLDSDFEGLDGVEFVRRSGRDS